MHSLELGCVGCMAVIAWQVWFIAVLLLLHIGWPQVLYRSPWQSPPKGASTQLIFMVGESGEGHVQLMAVPWSIYAPGSSEEERVRRALEDLLECSTAMARDWLSSPGMGKRSSPGYTSVPPNVRLLSLTQDPGLITADFTGRLERFREAAPSEHLHDRGRVVTLLAQVVFTATQFDPDSAVQVLIEGQRKPTLGQSDVDLSHPWRRADFLDFVVVHDTGRRRIFPPPAAPGD